MAPVARWNANIHHHRRIIGALPDSARSALDVGTGNGLLAAELRERIPHVVGLDSDAGVLDSARGEDPRVDWIEGDVMSHPFELGAFDVVASVATLHHLSDLDAAFARLAELTAPGGLVAVVGLARSASLTDHAWDAAGAVAHALLARRHGEWEHTAPTVWPPPHSYAEVRASALRNLPGAHWERTLLRRYVVLWRKPRP